MMRLFSDEGRTIGDPEVKQRPSRGDPCIYGDTCNSLKPKATKRCNFLHRYLMCKANENGELCGFAVPSEHCLRGINPIKEKDVSLLLFRRHECTRDLLVMPEAFVKGRKDPPGPHNNRQLVESPDMWSCVFKFIDVLETEAKWPADSQEKLAQSLLVNFGNWETAVNRSPGRLNCHGHIHLLLTKRGALRLGKFHKEFEGYMELPADDAHMKDLRDLQSYVNTVRGSTLTSAVGRIEK